MVCVVCSGGRVERGIVLYIKCLWLFLFVCLFLTNSPNLRGKKIYLPRSLTESVISVIWRSQTVCLICITSPPKKEQSSTGLGLYILLHTDMWSVRGQWPRGFSRTIKTDATFYLLNGREAERVALDGADARCWRLMTSFPPQAAEMTCEGGNGLLLLKVDMTRDVF